MRAIPRPSDQWPIRSPYARDLREQFRSRDVSENATSDRPRLRYRLLTDEGIEKVRWAIRRRARRPELESGLTVHVVFDEGTMR